jgi:hypothetical protein
MKLSDKGRRMSPTLRAFSGCALSIVFTACMAQAPQLPDGWQNDCVGQMSLSLPGVADISATPVPTMLSNIRVRESQPRAAFEDGQEDGYAELHVHGSLLLSRQVDAGGAQLLLTAQRRARSEAEQWIKRHPVDANGNRRRLVYVDDAGRRLVGWRIGASISALTLVGDTALLWSVSDSGDDVDVVQRNEAFLESLAHAEPRPFGLLPLRPGLCLPNVFVPVMNDEARNVAVSYRLKSHPDITVWLRDSNGGPVPEGMDPDKFTADYDNWNFWHQNYQDRKKGRLIWLKPHTVELDGIKGVSTFMELTREDDSIDYGYFASARGDASKESDPTNIQMFVIRRASVARAKGIEPVSKDEFIKMAESIAASVKRRPTSGR